MRVSNPIRLPNDFFHRVLSSFLILLISLPILLIGYYFVYWGRVIAFVFLGLFLFYSLFEVFLHFQTKKTFAFLLGFFGLFLFLLPGRAKIIDTFFSKETNFDWDLVSFLLKNQIFDYHIIAILPLVIIVNFFDKRIEKKRNFLIDSLLNFSIIIIASLFFKFLWILNTFNFFLVISLISIATISDSFGYFLGSLLGKKLFNVKFKFSPKKSIEGFIFSFIFGLILSLLIFLNFDFSIKIYPNLLFKILVMILLPIAAISGDAFFSIIKRYLKIKDFSQIIKAHGGLFDRLDSISFVFLVFSIIIIITS